MNSMCSFVFEGITRKRVPGGKDQGFGREPVSNILSCALVKDLHGWQEETDDAANEVMPMKTKEH